MGYAPGLCFPRYILTFSHGVTDPALIETTAAHSQLIFLIQNSASLCICTHYSHTCSVGLSTRAIPVNFAVQKCAMTAGCAVFHLCSISTSEKEFRLVNLKANLFYLAAVRRRYIGRPKRTKETSKNEEN